MQVESELNVLWEQQPKIDIFLYFSIFETMHSLHVFFSTPKWNEKIAGSMWKITGPGIIEHTAYKYGENNLAGIWWSHSLLLCCILYTLSSGVGGVVGRCGYISEEHLSLLIFHMRVRNSSCLFFHFRYDTELTSGFPKVLVWLVLKFLYFFKVSLTDNPKVSIQNQYSTVCGTAWQ